MINHLVRRGVEMTHDALTREGQFNSLEETKIEVPTWDMALLFGTAMFFILLLASVHYTLGEVVATLTMVETPTAAVIESENVKYADEPDAPLDQKEAMLAPVDVEQTVTVMPTKPITSKIRRTMKHLTSLSGFTCRWRGLKQAMVYNVLGGLMLGASRNLFPRVFGSHALTKVLVSIALSPVHAALTQRIVAKESPARTKALTAPFKTIKYLWAPAAFAAAAEEGTIALFHIAAIVMHDGHQEGADARIQVAKGGAILLAAILYTLFVVTPSQIGLTRVEAAFLPDDEDTVVPFDRTFGGKVFKTELGGWERHMAKTAFRSSNWEAIRRVVKLYGKIGLITFAIIMLGAHAVGFEMWAIMGASAKTVVMAGKARMEQM